MRCHRHDPEDIEVDFEDSSNGIRRSFAAISCQFGLPLPLRPP
jgi:hypothetical protein